MIPEQTLTQAIKLARVKHHLQRDKAGKSYLGHLYRVANSFIYDDNNIELRTISWLHDIVEDTDETPESLLNRGFPQHIVNAVVTLSHIAGENYQQYIERIYNCGDERVIKVKLADLQDNANLKRFEKPTSVDKARARKYKRAIKYLKTGAWSKK